MLNTINGTQIISQAIDYIQQPPTGIELSGWKNFSDMIGGFRMNEFTIFCGSTGSGKTQWLASIAAQLISQKVKCFIAPVETGAVDFGVRVLSVLSQTDFNTGHKINIPQARVLSATIEKHAGNFSDNLIFSSHDNRVDVTEMVQTLHYMSEERGVKVAILDNLNFFLKPTGANNALMEMDEAIHNFVMLAKKIPIHIILVMHPKKTENKSGSIKIRSEFDIKGSSTAVQEASNVLLMNRLDEDDIENKLGTFMTREFVFAKLRKRGYNVGKKFYMDYEGGAYAERINEPKGSHQPRTRSEFVSKPYEL